MVDEISHSLCKLLVALGEHSINHFAAHIAQPAVQGFLKLLLAYTALPGWYGADEEESEMTLGFWYLLQEALWSVDYAAYEGQGDAVESAQWAVAQALYMELVATLKRKVTWPGKQQLAGWAKGECLCDVLSCWLLNVWCRPERQIPGVSTLRSQLHPASS